jgi:hypothetical protein
MESSKALYVYGIVSNATPETTSIWQEPRSGVCLFPHQGICALVSEVSLDEFGESALAENLKKLDWVKEKVWAHEKALERVMRLQTVIPMKFGAIFTSEDGLKKVLADSYEAFQYLLRRLEGHLEWAVKMYGDSEALKTNVRKTNARVQAARAEMTGQPAGVAYLLEKKLETLVAEEVAVEERKRLQEIFNRLSVHASEGKWGDLSPRELTGKESPMIFNGIFLVARSQERLFIEQVANLKMEASELGWQLEQVGPFPPYNFSDLARIQEAHP